MDSPVLWCSLPQILPSFLIYLRNAGSMPSAAVLHESVYHRWHSCKWYRPNNLVEHHEKVLRDYSIDLTIEIA
jgi:hypothetical protein